MGSYSQRPDEYPTTASDLNDALAWLEEIS